MRLLLALAILSGVASTLPCECRGAAPLGVSPAQQGSVFDKVGITPQFGQPVPIDVEFTDSEGASVKLGQCLGDKPVILHLVYFQCPMLCQLARDGLIDALSTISLQLGDDYRVVTLSFDPHDTSQLAKSAKQMALQALGAENRADAWRVLTGEQPAIQQVCDAMGFRYAFDPATNQYAHASGVFVLTPQGKLSRFLGGVDFAPRDLQLALVDASEEKIGTAVDSFLLLCFHYDPTTGKYGLAIMSVLRGAAAATLTVLVGYVVLMIRRERGKDDALDAATANPENAPQ